jgi:carbon-monoxide dehydrogenase medium subunit
VKPGRFVYHAPTTLREALDVLAEVGDVGKVLAGGQSLLPLLNFRIAAPEHLVDINRLPDLDRVSRHEGGFVVPALVRQRQLEQSPELAEAFALLPQAVAEVAHPQIRNRGTLCGSLAHGDAAAEMPTVMTALGARMRVASAREERVVAAEDFFTFHLTTALAEDELLTAVELDLLPTGTRSAFVELAPRRGDFALAGVAAVVTCDPDGGVGRARLVASGVGPKPVRLHQAESTLLGERLSPGLLAAAAVAASAEVDPTGDAHASAQYRSDLVGALLRRAVDKATSTEEDRRAA